MVEISIVTLVVLGILGLIDTGYLIWKQKKKQPLVCPIGENCNVVLESRWNKIFFVKNEVLGFLFYVFIIGIGIFLSINGFGGLLNKTFLIIITGASVLFSVILVFIQTKVIKNFCFYCLISALITFLIFVNILVL